MSRLVAPTPAQVATARAEQREREVDAEDALSRVHGAQGLKAATLALLLPAGNATALRAWELETEALPGAAAMLLHAQALTRATRLPWLERLTLRLRSHPIEARRSVALAARRVTSAEGTIQPLDRLHWLAMRQWLGEPAAAGQQTAATGELNEMPPGDVQAVARYSAFLSRLIPGNAAGANAGRPWYDAVTARWAGQPEAAFAPPDGDAMVTALLTLQSLAWMQRPMLLRAWVDAALAASRPQNPRQTGPGASGLHDDAADALRLTGALLDSPLPPELARHYREPKPETSR